MLSRYQYYIFDCAEIGALHHYLVVNDGNDDDEPTSNLKQRILFHQIQKVSSLHLLYIKVVAQVRDTFVAR